MKVASKDFDDLNPAVQQRLRSAAKLLATGAMRAAAKAAGGKQKPDKGHEPDCKPDSQ